jgi:DNA-binding SARP family transcriptional activator
MNRVRLLGAPALERDGSFVTGRAAQRHRLALLALLALSPGNRLGRDRLIATLWPESDAERGRNLLKVATYVLRSALGEDVLLTVGDELRLNTDLVIVDVAEFDAAVEQGDHARAIELYPGPFLDGFFLSDAPEFEQWVDGERARLASAYAGALEGAADAAAVAGDATTALNWWKLRAAHDPYDSRVALRLMHAFDAARCHTRAPAGG